MDLTQLRQQGVYLQRTLKRVSKCEAQLLPGGFFAVLAACFALSCAHVSTMPESPYSSYSFPEGEAYLEKPDRLYDIVDEVRSKVDFSTLDADRSQQKLCQNYFNQAVNNMVRQSRRLGADAIIHVKSVTYLLNGQKEEHSGPECVDTGDEGQVITKALAVRWRKPKASRYR